MCKKAFSWEHMGDNIVFHLSYSDLLNHLAIKKNDLSNVIIVGYAVLKFSQSDWKANQ